MELAAVATVLAAMGGVLKLVLDYLKRLDEAHAEDTAARDKAWQAALEAQTQALSAQMQEQRTFFGNHLSSTTRALDALVTVVESLAASVDSVVEGGEDDGDSR